MHPRNQGLPPPQPQDQRSRRDRGNHRTRKEKWVTYHSYLLCFHLSNDSSPLCTFRMLRIFSSVRMMSSLISRLMIVLRVLLLHPSLKILRTNPRTSLRTDHRQDIRAERRTSPRCSQHPGQSQGSLLRWASGYGWQEKNKNKLHARSLTKGFRKII